MKKMEFFVITIYRYDKRHWDRGRMRKCYGVVCRLEHGKTGLIWKHFKKLKSTRDLDYARHTCQTERKRLELAGHQVWYRGVDSSYHNKHARLHGSEISPAFVFPDRA